MGLQADERRRKAYDGVDVAAAVEQAKPQFVYQPWLGLDDWRCTTCGTSQRPPLGERPTTCHECNHGT